MGGVKKACKEDGRVDLVGREEGRRKLGVGEREVGLRNFCRCVCL